MEQLRADKEGAHRVALAKNRKIIYATQKVCGICGKPVDFSLKYPDPLSPTIDPIIPIIRGGHPSALENLQLAHWTCNRQKADKLQRSTNQNTTIQADVLSNRILPQSRDWSKYRSE